MNLPIAVPKPSFVLLGYLAALLALGGCTGQTVDNGDQPLVAVATTNLVADLVKSIAGEHVAVTGLMGAGVDPHLYKPSEGDVTRMAGADIIFYSGLHLEGKMSEVFEKMSERGINTVAVTDGIPEDRLIQSANFPGNYDPHVWFDPDIWIMAAGKVSEFLSEVDTVNADYYRARTDELGRRYDLLKREVVEIIETVPPDRRILVTSHDAFEYFGRAFGFTVRGLQGISTVAEAGAADVQELAQFVADRKIPSLFIESSVSPRGIEAVRQAVRSRGHEVTIGGHLYSDALGDPGTPDGTYTGMMLHNVRTVATALTSPTPS